MKATDIRNLTDDELGAKAQDARAELFNLRMQQTTGALEKPSRIRVVRKDLARVETVMSERRNAARSKA
jgi:large subunit ribosomal protein L29